ncbi:MAG TPA: S8 family serine peptidase, partial [Verrucomicrobiae bacterium]
MRLRTWFGILLCLLVAAGAWFFWPVPKMGNPAKKSARTISTSVHSSSTAPDLLADAAAGTNSNQAGAVQTNRFAYRLANTTKSIGELVNDRKAILLENALIDTSGPLNLSLPQPLRAQGDPGAYIVQARGPINAAFRALLARAGAETISYIPNNAYLVRIAAGGANLLAAQSLVQSVIPYEPYYKIQSSLLGLAVEQKLLPATAMLNLGLFANAAPQTIQEIEKLGGKILARSDSPFGPVVRVQPPADWTALAALPGVQIVEAWHPRVHANDLSRATTQVAADTQVSTNYFGLTGRNVIVAVPDSGIDASHPDLTGRVLGFTPGDLLDTDGHGTHVAGTIAGDGTESMTVVNAQGSIMPATNGQFRGMAPAATLLAMNMNDDDRTLQEAAAVTNAPISNNSWNLEGDNAYDLEAAIYDAGTRDALA